MKDLQAAFEKCINLCDGCNIPYRTITSITVNNRLYACLGRCIATRNWNGKYSFRIEMNPAMILDSVSDHDFEEVILHEIIHTCDGCWNHGGKWKWYAKIVNDRYGYSISRTGDTPEAIARQENHLEIRYVVSCERCGKDYTYKKAGKVVKYPQHYRCGNCKGNLYLKWNADDAQILKPIWERRN